MTFIDKYNYKKKIFKSLLKILVNQMITNWKSNLPDNSHLSISIVEHIKNRE